MSTLDAAVHTSIEARSDARFSDVTTLRVGGPIGSLVTARSESEIVDTVGEADATGTPLMILGGGSNLLVADEGFAGTVLRIANTGIDCGDQCGGARITVGAGESWDGFVAEMIRRGYAGIEALSGIPGLVGATPIQNVGAYGQEVSQTIDRVRVLDRTTHEVSDIPVKECRFDYRTSRFKQEPDRYVVLGVVFELHRSSGSRPIKYPELARNLDVGVGDQAATEDVRATVLRLRAGKGMVLDPNDHDTWSAGSFFTNPIVSDEVDRSLPVEAPAFPIGPNQVKVSAAWLIEYSGFPRGYGNDRASVSGKHTLALTNRGSAKAADMVSLAREIRDGVEAKTRIRLVPEPVLVGIDL